MNSKKVCLPLIIYLLVTGCTHKYYVVRHAEKAAAGSNMTSDVHLSEAGQARAGVLSTTLQSKNIKRIFSTPTIRTRSTAEPLSRTISIPISEYGPAPDSNFIKQVKAIRSNTLIVGHSNTVDDIVNALAGYKAIPGDLNDSEYNNLFVVINKRFPAKKVKVEKLKYGLK